MNLADVIRFLETRQREIYDAPLYAMEMSLDPSPTKVEAWQFALAAEALRDLRDQICGEEGE